MIEAKYDSPAEMYDRDNGMGVAGHAGALGDLSPAQKSALNAHAYNPQFAEERTARTKAGGLTGFIKSFAEAHLHRAKNLAAQGNEAAKTLAESPRVKETETNDQKILRQISFLNFCIDMMKKENLDPEKKKAFIQNLGKQSKDTIDYIPETREQAEQWIQELSSQLSKEQNPANRQLADAAHAVAHPLEDGPKVPDRESPKDVTEKISNLKMFLDVVDSDSPQRKDRLNQMQPSLSALFRVELNGNPFRFDPGSILWARNLLKELEEKGALTSAAKQPEVVT